MRCATVEQQTGFDPFGVDAVTLVTMRRKQRPNAFLEELKLLCLGSLFISQNRIAHDWQPQQLKQIEDENSSKPGHESA